MNDVFWIEGNPPPTLAVVLCPRGDERLEGELRRYKSAGVRTIVSLLEEEEADWLGLAAEASTAAQLGMAFVSFPIPDSHIPPNPPAFREFIAGLVRRLRQGERIGVHCRGSIGRATLTTAATLIHLGWKPAAALAAIERTRGCSVPDTEEQRRWILSYGTPR